MFNYEIKLFVLWLIANEKLCDYNFMKKQNKRNENDQKWRIEKTKNNNKNMINQTTMTWIIASPFDS